VSPGAAIEAPAPLGGSRKAITALALALGTFMQVLDTSIANVSIPTIAGNLGVSSDQGTWVITSFAVANGVSVPLTGWLMQRFGVVRTFVISVALFTIASLLCGLAWSLPSLIAFRVLQGSVSGPMIPGSQALLMNVFGPAKRPTALAIWSVTTLVAPIAGPLLGGYISDNYIWPWIFLINIPVGAFCAFVCWTNLKSQETPTRKLPMDRVGLALLFIWVGALQIMLDKGKDLDWFNSSVIVILLIVTLIAFVAWLIWELTEEHPIVDLALFRLRNFWVSTVALLCAYGLYFGNVVLLPLWLQQYMGYTATLAGLVLAPVGLLAMVFTPFVGRFSDRIDPRILVTISFAVFALVLFMRARFNTDATIATLLVPTLIQGAGMAAFFIPLMSMTLSGLPPERIPAASGLSNFARITAGSFGTSITTTLWDRRATLHHAQLVEHLTPNDPVTAQALGNLHASGMGQDQSYALLNRMVDSQAFMLSANDIFYVSGLLFLGLIFLVWLARPLRGGLGAPSASAAH
jgi:MFS transporter, DHA2 family, multidrug resistance protein